MDCNLVLKRFKETAKLEKLIKQNASKKKILAQSQLLDKYILLQCNQMTTYCENQKKLVS